MRTRRTNIKQEKTLPCGPEQRGWMMLKGLLGDWRGCMEPVEKIRESCVDVAQNRQAAVLNSLASKICQIAAVGWRPGGGGEGDEEQAGPGGSRGNHKNDDRGSPGNQGLHVPGQLMGDTDCRERVDIQGSQVPIISSIPVKASPLNRPTGIVHESRAQSRSVGFNRSSDCSEDVFHTPEPVRETRDVGVGQTPLGFQSIGIGQTPAECRNVGTGITPVRTDNIGVGQTPLRTVNEGAVQTVSGTVDNSSERSPVKTPEGRTQLHETIQVEDSCIEHPMMLDCDEAVGRLDSSEKSKGCVPTSPDRRDTDVNHSTCPHCGIQVVKGVFCCTGQKSMSSKRRATVASGGVGNALREQTQGNPAESNQGACNSGSNTSGSRRRFSEKWTVEKSQPFERGAKRERSRMDRTGASACNGEDIVRENIEAQSGIGNTIACDESPGTLPLKPELRNAQDPFPQNVAENMSAVGLIDVDAQTAESEDEEERSPKRLRLANKEQRTSPPRLGSQSSFKFPVEQGITSPEHKSNAAGEVLPLQNTSDTNSSPEKQQVFSHSNKEGNGEKCKKEKVNARIRLDTEMIFNGFPTGVETKSNQQPSDLDFTFPVQSPNTNSPTMLDCTAQQQTTQEQPEISRANSAAVGPDSASGTKASVPAQNQEGHVLNDHASQNSRSHNVSSFFTRTDPHFDQSSITGKQDISEKQDDIRQSATNLQRLKADAVENHSFFQASWGMLMKHVEHPPGSKAFLPSSTIPREPGSKSVEPATMPQSEALEPAMLLREPSLKHFSTVSLSHLPATQDKVAKAPKIGQTSTKPPPAISEDETPTIFQGSQAHLPEAQPVSDPTKSRMSTEAGNEVDLHPQATALAFRVASPSRIPSPPSSPRQGGRNNPSTKKMHAEDNDIPGQLSRPLSKVVAQNLVKGSPNEQPFKFVGGLKEVKKETKIVRVLAKSPEPVRSFLLQEEKKETRMALGQHKVKVPALERAKIVKQQQDNAEKEKAERKKLRQELRSKQSTAFHTKETRVKRPADTQSQGPAKKAKTTFSLNPKQQKVKDIAPDPKNTPLTPKYKLTQFLQSGQKQKGVDVKRTPAKKEITAGAKVSIVAKTPSTSKPIHTLLKNSSAAGESTPQYELTPPSVTAKFPNEEQKTYRRNKTIPSWAKPGMKLMDNVVGKLKTVSPQDVFGHISKEASNTLDLYEVFGTPENIETERRWQTRARMDWSNWKG